MDKKIERIHELLGELADAVKDAFPDYTMVSTNCSTDGYRTFTVLKWKNVKGKPVEAALRKTLFCQTKVNDNYDWDNDTSEKQNEYCKKHGILLEDD